MKYWTEDEVIRDRMNSIDDLYYELKDWIEIYHLYYRYEMQSNDCRSDEAECLWTDLSRKTDMVSKTVGRIKGDSKMETHTIEKKQNTCENWPNPHKQLDEATKLFEHYRKMRLEFLELPEDDERKDHADICQSEALDYLRFALAMMI